MTTRRPQKKKRAARPPDPNALPRPRFLAETREYFNILTRSLIAERIPATGGRDFALQYTRMVDTIVGVLFQRAAEDHGISTDETETAVIAMGGYGRQELAPFSDVDILVACRQRTPRVEAVAQSFIQLMWDAGFELGHAVESLVESEKALTQHIDTKTALIESRWVCGSRRLARAVERQVTRIRRKDREEYLRRKVHDALARHEKNGRSFQLIEPNVKLSPGGMRDFQTLVWLGQVGRAVRGLAALRHKGLLLRGEQRELETAYDFLLRVRIELHLTTKSKQDQLTVDRQRELARALGYAPKRGHLAVEFFMREYYMHTRAILRITEDCLEALGHGDNVGVMLGRGRVARGSNKLNLPIRRDKIVREPLYVFERQKQTGQKLDRALRRRLEHALGEYLSGAATTKRMRRDFPELLADDKNASLVVRSLHETLFLMRIIPEYDRLTCLKRYDLYHHYTVDEHSFKVMENIIALGQGKTDNADPFVRLYSEIPNKRVLLLAALLHDIGKIEGRGHAKKGAALAQRILKRMSLPTAEIDQVTFLIRNHLIMSHFSQRRDPSDIGTMTAFCETVGNRTNLKYLCLLTYADYRATSPLVWNEWKATLLMDLYLSAYDFIARREKAPEEVYKRHKRRLLDAFAGKEERAHVLAHIDQLPGRYLLTMSAGMVREHMDMIARLRAQPFAIRHDSAGAAQRVTFCTPDKPYRLSELCGVLAINNFNILHAYAFTRRDGTVIDVFDVEPMTKREGNPEEGLADDLRRVLDGALDLDEAMTDHASRWRRLRKRGIPVAARVEFENDVSDEFTIIDVFAHDRPGLLYHITRTLSREGLTIFRANISTEATRAIDSFYVGDRQGGKVTDATRIRRLRTVLEGTLAQA